MLSSRQMTKKAKNTCDNIQSLYMPQNYRCFVFLPHMQPNQPTKQPTATSSNVGNLLKFYFNLFWIVFLFGLLNVISKHTRKKAQIFLFIAAILTFDLFAVLFESIEINIVQRYAIVLFNVFCLTNCWNKYSR